MSRFAVCGGALWGQTFVSGRGVCGAGADWPPSARDAGGPTGAAQSHPQLDCALQVRQRRPKAQPWCVLPRLCRPGASSPPLAARCGRIPHGRGHTLLFLRCAQGTSRPARSSPSQRPRNALRARVAPAHRVSPIAARLRSVSWRTRRRTRSTSPSPASPPSRCAGSLDLPAASLRARGGVAPQPLTRRVPGPPRCPEPCAPPPPRRGQ